MGQPIEPIKNRGIRQMLTNVGEVRAAVMQVTGVANRTLSILTHDLEPDVYDHDDFLETLKKFILDLPNERSLHTSPTPRGGGMAIALSVMVIFSGQTFVQHLVMLQYPIPYFSFSSGMRSAVSSGFISRAAV